SSRAGRRGYQTVPHEVCRALRARRGNRGRHRKDRLSAWRETALTTGISKRSLVLNGHKTSISLEDTFWDALKQMAHEKNQTAAQAVAAIDQAREGGNLSSAVRVAIFEYFVRMNGAPTQAPAAAESDHP